MNCIFLLLFLIYHHLISFLWGFKGFRCLLFSFCQILSADSLTNFLLLYPHITVFIRKHTEDRKWHSDNRCENTHCLHIDFCRTDPRLKHGNSHYDQPALHSTQTLPKTLWIRQDVAALVFLLQTLSIIMNFHVFTLCWNLQGPSCKAISHHLVGILTTVNFVQRRTSRKTRAIKRWQRAAKSSAQGQETEQ